MKAEQNDHTKDYGGEEYLRDVVVEDLLIGVRDVGDSGFFLSGCLYCNDLIDYSQVALLCLDVHNSPYKRTQGLPWSNAQKQLFGEYLISKVRCL
jgi:hypothetical protein